MIKWLWRLLVRVLWGKPTRPTQDIAVTQIGSDRAKPIMYGRMVVQVYLNRRADGTLNPKFRVRREVKKNGGKLVDSFFLEDIDDVILGLHRAKAWANDLLEIE